MGSHPLIRFSTMKELHFFDNNESWAKGLSKYMHYFRPMPYDPNDSKNTPMTTEATPFYVASRIACKRMAQVVPNAKLIILLREPISRAVSEYKMKIRRVLEQNSFLKLLSENGNALEECIRTYPLIVESQYNVSALEIPYPQHPEAIMLQHQQTLMSTSPVGLDQRLNRVLAPSCVPIELRMHTQWSRFSGALSSAFKLLTRDTRRADLIRQCFGDEEEPALTHSMSQRRRNAGSSSRTRLASAVSDAASGSWASVLHTAQAVAMTYLGTGTTSDGDSAAQDAVADASDSNVGHAVAHNEPRKRFFQTRKCLKK